MVIEYKFANDVCAYSLCTCVNQGNCEPIADVKNLKEWQSKAVYRGSHCKHKGIELTPREYTTRWVNKDKAEKTNLKIDIYTMRYRYD